MTDASFRAAQAAYDAQEPPEGDDECEECDGEGRHPRCCVTICGWCGRCGEDLCLVCGGTGRTPDDGDRDVAEDDGDTTGWDPADDTDEDPTDPEAP